MKKDTIIEYKRKNGASVQTKTASDSFTNAAGDEMIYVIGERDPLPISQVTEKPKPEISSFLSASFFGK